ncbi:g225 [Coccomyxa elongata]
MASSQYSACKIRFVEALFRKVLASIIICLNSNALKVAAKQLISISISQEPGSNAVQKLNGPKESTVTCNLRLLGGLVWLQVGVKKPQLTKGASCSSSSGSSATSACNTSAAIEQQQSKPQVLEQESHSQVQVTVDQTGKRVPLLTSSTESFKVGLKSYAELQIPKHAATGGYPPSLEQSPVKKQRGPRMSGSTAQSAPSFMVIAATGNHGEPLLGGQKEEDTSTSGVHRSHPLRETSRPNTKAVTASVAMEKGAVSSRLLPVDGAAHILSANPVLLPQGQPTPDMAGVKKLSKGKKGGSSDSGSGGSAGATTPDGIGSSGSSTKTSGRSQGPHKENTYPWR